MLPTRFTESRVVREVTCNLTYSDTTSARIFTLPKGARFVHWVINVKTAFAGGTKELDVGIRSDADYFIDELDVSAVGQTTVADAAKHPGHNVTTLGEEVYASVGGSNTQGDLDVTLLFSMEQGTPFT